jgi:hypothetical protein
MNQFIDDFYDVLFKPSAGIARVVRERSVWNGVLVYLTVSLITSIATFGSGNTEILFGEWAQYLPPETMTSLIRSWPILNLILTIVLTPLLLFLWSAVLQFSAELMGGKGHGLQVAAGLGYAQLPYLLLAPFGLLARYLAVDIVSVASFAAFIWSILLKIEVLRAVHSFSRGRAALVYFLPVITLFVAMIFLMLLMGSFLMPLLSELVPLS